MNTFDYVYDYQQKHVTLHFNFSTDEELLEKWEGNDTTYKLSVELVSASGHFYNNNNDSVTVSGTGLYSMECRAGNGSTENPINVYGVYFREFEDPQPTDLRFNWQIGNNTEYNKPAGFGDPSEGCTYTLDTVTYPDNEHDFVVNGSHNVGPFEQAGHSWFTIITHALDAMQLYNTNLDQGEIEATFNVMSTIPIWDSFSHCHAYKTSGMTNVTGLLNGYIAPDEESFGRYYINNLVSNNGNISNIREENYYRFNGVDKCLGFSSEDGIHATLHSYNGGPTETYKSDNRGVTYDRVNSYPSSYYMRTETQEHAYVITFNTNIPMFVGDENDSGADKLDSYMRGTPAPSGREYNLNDTWNRSEVDGTITGVIGELVNQTVNGTSSVAYTYGVQMFSLTATQKAQFLRSILSNANITDIMRGTELFGSDNIGAIQSLRYMPVDASEVCSIGSASSCQIGSYTHTFSSPVNQILQNNKMINCGSAFFKAPYETGDFRNVEPWCKMYIALPYSGVYPLAISKYINTRVGIKLAIDITTGAIEYHIFANNLEMDSFTGQMGCQIPLTAKDKASQVASIHNAITQKVEGLAQIDQTVLSIGQAMQGNVASAMSQGGSFSGVTNAYNDLQTARNIYNTFTNAPIQTKGAPSGNLGDFGIVSPYFIFCWANSLTPKNEINLVGKPSNTGGKVNQFAGFLKCSAFNLVDGFTGTQTEAEEISAIMANGVYC